MSESRHLCRKCRPPHAGGSGLTCSQPGCCAGRGSRPPSRQITSTKPRCPTTTGCSEKGVSGSENFMDTIPPAKDPRECLVPPEERDNSPSPLASGGSQASQIQIFNSCHHHTMAAHQGVVRTAALIKRRFYWPRMQKDVEAWCKRCTACARCKTTVRGHSELQQPKHGAFNERVSVDLIGPLHRTERGNEYIVVMQDHFTKWIEGAALPTK